MKGEVLGDGAALVLHADDNVATALEDLEPDDRLDEDTAAVESVPFGHKVALEPIATGEEVVKYGEVIGRATDPIDPGEWVHTHNCESNRGRGDLAAKGVAES
jgi:altronate dehydratase small subunit